jgi:nitrite reductase (cytochrome c-552)
MAESSANNNDTNSHLVPNLPLWAGLVIAVLAAGSILLLGLLAVSIMERRWESQRPVMVLKPVADYEPDSANWGVNYPRQYDSFLQNRISDTKTKFGGASHRDYLDADPRKVILWTGSAFSRDYLQARGHYYSVEDVTKSKRLSVPFNAATCWTCKSTDTPRMMAKMSVREFYAGNFHDLKNEMTHPVGCRDCHDPQTMKLQITRPALREAFAAMGADINSVTHQQMRSLVCAQCHAEYYFRTDESAGMKNYMVFPWKNGTGAEAILSYYNDINFTDFVNPISKTPMTKVQHPDYEIYLTGIHAYRDVSCADCHMPYRTEGGSKFTDHHVQSPLLNISASCAVCHRWSEDEIRSRVEAIQIKMQDSLIAAEDAMVEAHFDIAAAFQAGVSDNDLSQPRHLLRDAQFYWDYVSSSNGMGFHSPTESMRITGQATDLAQQARVSTARLLAEKGISKQPAYPDISSRQNASQVSQQFTEGHQTKLLP